MSGKSVVSKLYIMIILVRSVLIAVVLAQNNYLKSPEFLNYLEYLSYWRLPEYAQFLTYPACLHHLTLLESARFRSEISRADVARKLNDELYYEWLDGRHKRSRDS